jgi:hypothetical protein
LASSKHPNVKERRHRRLLFSDALGWHYSRFPPHPHIIRGKNLLTPAGVAPMTLLGCEVSGEAIIWAFSPYFLRGIVQFHMNMAISAQRI